MDQKQKEWLAKKIQSDPKFFFNKILGNYPWGKQLEIANAVRDHKYVTVRSAQGIGKSWVAGRIALQFLIAFPDSIVLTTAPTHRQVEDILWREIRGAYHASKVKLGGEILKKRLNISDSWYAFGFSTNDPFKFFGFHPTSSYILVIIDEASGFDEKGYEGIDGLLTPENARLLLIGNPTMISGRFYDSFKSPLYRKFHLSAFHSPNFTSFGITLDDIRKNEWEKKITGKLPHPYLTTPQWVYERYIEWGEESPLFQARILGEFPQQGSDAIIFLSWIERAKIAKIKSEDAPIEMGVDVARYGDDKTVFVIRKGAETLDIQVFSQMNTMETAGRLVQEIKRWNPETVRIDEIGMGAGVVDRLAEQNFKEVKGVNVAEKADDSEQFVNLRAELWWGLRKRFEDKDISIPDNDDLTSQLTSIKWKTNSRGQIQIESKENMKKRGLSSPDLADAMVLAFAATKVDKIDWGFA